MCSETRFYFPGGVALGQSCWISQPPGHTMVNLAGSLPHRRNPAQLAA